MKDVTPPKKAIKQSTLTLILNVTSILLIISCCLSFYYIIKSNERVSKAANDRYELSHYAKRFMEASDYLRNEVKAYAATGDIVHSNNYWNEINKEKNGDFAVAKMREIGITYHEQALVTEMHALSNNLIPLEKEAMSLAAAGDTKRALEAVYGWSYDDWIARIGSAQKKFLTMLDERTERQLAEERRSTFLWTIITLVCLGVTAIIQVLSAAIVRIKFIRPLLMVRDEMLALERGNLSSTFDATADTSEMGMLIGSLLATKAELNRTRHEVTEKLAAIAHGDNFVRIDSDYPGDFAEMKDSINEIAKILGAQRERDERIRKELQVAYEGANAANRAKSNFLSSMSHEIRTPMNAIIGMTNIAMSSEDTVRREQCLHKIHDASNHLLGVINDILDMSKIDSGKFELSPVEFNFEKMLIRVINIINFRVDEKNQKLRVHFDPDTPTYLIADDQRLAQVITNLLSNAVKFTPEGGEIGVEVRLMREDAMGCHLYIAVTDTGIGISPEQQEKLFTSFTQADNGVSRKYGGTGLGLAISKSIVEKMGGRIWVESEESKGSKFAFEFIAARAEGAEEDQILLPGVKWDDLRILAVDDDAAIRDYFQNTALRFNFYCDVAASGTEALEKVAAGESYNLFFIDWKMPDFNGLELAARIRNNEEDNAAIIMISSTEWSVIENDARAVGVDRFLSKPLFASVIIEMINECLGVGVSLTKTHDTDLPDFSKHHILLAEDNEVNREIVIGLLEPTGISITTAENGAIALDTFAKAPESFDMIFMDMHMPEMDGSTATVKIRSLANPYAKKIPIVAMTANVFREDIERCLEIGMNDHIGKPLDFDEVLDKMKRYLGKKS